MARCAWPGSRTSTSRPPDHRSAQVRPRRGADPIADARRLPGGAVKPSVERWRCGGTRSVHLDRAGWEGLTGAEGCRMLPRRVGGSMVTLVSSYRRRGWLPAVAGPAAPGTAARPHARHGRGRRPRPARRSRALIFLRGQFVNAPSRHVRRTSERALTALPSGASNGQRGDALICR
jgi:hypothetical protein